MVIKVNGVGMSEPESSVGESRVSRTDRRIRIGLVLPGETVSAWQARVIQGVLESPDVTCELVVLCGASSGERWEGSSRSVQNASPSGPVSLRGSLFHAYEWVDRLLTKKLGGATDAFELKDVSAILCSLPSVTLSQEGVGPAEAQLKKAELEVILDLVGDAPPFLADHTKHGIWSLEHGDAAAFGHEPATFWEMQKGRRVGITQLMVLLGNGEKRCIYRSYSRLHEFSLHMNQNASYWKAAEFWLRRLSLLRVSGWAAIEALETFREGPKGDGQKAQRSGPGSAEVVGLWAELARRAARRSALDFRTQKSWRIGWRRVAEPGTSEKGQWNFLIPPKERFYADPFLVRHEGQSYLFFEDYVRAQGRALISWVRINEATSEVSPAEVAFATQDHLSYPYVFKWEGEVYLMPERRAQRRIELWRAQAFPREWILDRVLIDSLDAVDATWFQANDRFWILTNIAPKGATSAADELHLFYSRTPFGPFMSHPMNPIVSNVRGARPGGRVFSRTGALIRPGQDSSARYGGRIILHQIDELTEERYSEREVGTIEADWFPGCLGTHTYDCDGHVEVLDGFERPLRKVWSGVPLVEKRLRRT